MATRRGVIGGIGAATAIPAAVQADGRTPDARVAADLATYIGFGDKASGGRGDTACGAWLERELRAAGAATMRQAFDVPFFTVRRAELAAGNARASVLSLAIVVPTGAAGIAGPIVRVEPGVVPAMLQGAIALVDLPHARWSSAMAKPVADTLRAVTAAGAVAAVLVTNGPTGKAIALNADGARPIAGCPVAVLAPEASRPFRALAASGGVATLTIDGDGGRRPAFNLVARWDRGRGRTLVVSTPRSGWTACAGERGPGIAAWLALARWAPRALAGHDLLFLCNSGHEYENLGSAHALQAVAPTPERTAFWLHLGANVAARDWHEGGGGRLLPLPSADPQRFLVATPPLVPLARACFAGIAGLEAVYPSDGGSAGELSTILAAGHQRAAGIFGAHRYHHVAEDDTRCVDPALVTPVIAACQRLIRRVTM